MLSQPAQPTWPAGAIFTVGHSTRPIDEFMALLQVYDIARVIDIRSVPKSRYNPQFSIDPLSASLAAAGIGYRHEPELGGMRDAVTGSINTAWPRESFRGYADHMQTTQFIDAVEALIALGTRERLTLMCAEAVPWQCHRSLVGDALIVRGVTVVDILSANDSHMHVITPFAHVEGMQVTYPGQQELFEGE